MANAFETAVRAGRDESLTAVSAARLMEKAEKLNAAYGGDGATCVLNLTEAAVNGFGEVVKSMEELLKKSVPTEEE